MKSLAFHNGNYRTEQTKPSLFARFAPAVSFYADILSIVIRASRLARRGKYDDNEWSNSSLETIRAMERVGGIFEISGIDNIRTTKNEPCVFIGNHMSTLETFALPVLIVPFKPVTFVVKQSLVEYPVFKHVMRSRNPITVCRTNPRDDLKAVLEGGEARLRNGVSIVIFPQTTRSELFDPAEFNTIGIKLARRAGAPVVPIALKTDAWGNGRYLKDFGRIDPKKKIHIAFGEPIRITGRGDEEHRKVIEFISAKLRQWGGIVAAAKAQQPQPIA